MKNLLAKIDQKKKQLDRLRPLSADAVKKLEKQLRVELTYASNAIEGNPLSRLETAETLKKIPKLLTIGQLARLANEPISTLRFWIQTNLLTVSGRTKSDYQLFDQNALKTIQKIRQLQKEKRLTIKEIKVRL